MDEKIDSTLHGINAVHGTDLSILFDVFLKISLTVLFLSLLAFAVNKIVFPLCGIEFEIKGHKFGGHFDFGGKKKKKSNAEDQGEHEDHAKVFYDAMLTSAKQFASKIDQETLDKYEDLSRETKDKLKQFVHRLLGMYKTEVEESSRSTKEEKELYLKGESLEYFKNLLYLASYENSLVDKIIKIMSDIMELDKLEGSIDEKERMLKQLSEEFTDAIKSPFVEKSFQFHDKIDSKSAEVVITKQAQREVGQIWENLQKSFSIRQSKYADQIARLSELMIHQMKEEGDKERNGD